MAAGAAPRIVSRVYFFEKRDGSIIAIDGDREAWNMYAHPTKIFVHELPPKLIGTSDGRHYMNAMNMAKEYAKEHGLEAAQKMVREAYLAEIEIARKTVVPPPNFDTVDKFGNATKL